MFYTREVAEHRETKKQLEEETRLHKWEKAVLGDENKQLREALENEKREHYDYRVKIRSRVYMALFVFLPYLTALILIEVLKVYFFKAGTPNLAWYIIGAVIATILVSVLYEKGKAWCKDIAEKHVLRK